MKQINIYLDDVEYEKLLHFKEGKGWTWKDMIVRYIREDGQ